MRTGLAQTKVHGDFSLGYGYGVPTDQEFRIDLSGDELAAMSKNGQGRRIRVVHESANVSHTS